MYAIVDIETTGGYAANNDITEVAIVLHNGREVVSRFESLVKPVRDIPYYIQVLTGITPAMVQNAPFFGELAPRIASMLEGTVFIAHNVNFDYSFLKHHLGQAGYELNCHKLCTVRLARKIFPGLPSYSLGNLCRHFSIVIENRHRAGGDAMATATLFSRMLESNGLVHIEQFLKRGSKEQFLPPNLAKEALQQLPYGAGVYYFHDQKGQVIYVGKAKNLRYRVQSHFSHNGAGRQKQDFLRNIYHISYQPCATELMAFILESVEIRRLWPQFNYSQKRFAPVYGLYSYEDQNGYRRLVIEKKRKYLQPLYTFNFLPEGHRLLQQLVKQYQLCHKLCHLQTDNDRCAGLEQHICHGACEQKEPAEQYNARLQEAVEWLTQLLPTFAVVDEGSPQTGPSCILIEKGRFYGMGYLPAGIPVSDVDTIKPHLTPYPENDYIRGLVYQYAERWPQKKVAW